MPFRSLSRLFHGRALLALWTALAACALVAWGRVLFQSREFGAAIDATAISLALAGWTITAFRARRRASSKTIYLRSLESSLASEKLRNERLREQAAAGAPILAVLPADFAQKLPARSARRTGLCEV